MSRNARTLCLIFLVGVLLLPTVGCVEFNETINNWIKKKLVSFKLKVAERVLEGILTGALKITGILPDGTKVEPKVEIKENGDWSVTFKIPLKMPLGGSKALNTNISGGFPLRSEHALSGDPNVWVYFDVDPNVKWPHVGIDIEPNAPNAPVLKQGDIYILQTFLIDDPNEPDTWIEVASAPNLDVRHDATLGRVLDVTNPSSFGVRVTALEVAVSTKKIPLEELTYYNPNVLSLSWIPVISTATDFSARETKTFDVPDGTLLDFCYARTLFEDTTGMGSSGEVVYVCLNPAIPVVCEWGLIVMAGVLLTAGAIVIVRRRRLVAT